MAEEFNIKDDIFQKISRFYFRTTGENFLKKASYVTLGSRLG
jgi:hypothetical protein